MNTLSRHISIKKVICIILSFITILLRLPVPSNAVGEVIDIDTATKAGAVIVDLYGMANNTSLAYEYLDEGSALTVIETLYNDYAAASGDPTTLAVIGAAALAAGCIAVVYDAITGQGKIQLYQTQYVSSLDGFWDYACNDMGLTRSNSDGLFHWLSDTGVALYQNDALRIGALSIQSFSHIELTASNNVNLHFINVRGNTYYTFWGNVNNVNDVAVVIVSGDSNPFAQFKYGTPIYGYTTKDIYSSFQTWDGQYAQTLNGVFKYSGSWGVDSSLYTPQYWSDSPQHIPVELVGNGTVAYDRAAVVCSPYFYVGDPLTYEPTIEYPNPADPNYEPEPQRVQTNVEVSPEVDPLPDGAVVPTPNYPYPVTNPQDFKRIVDEIWRRMTDDDPDNDVQIEDAHQPDPDPDPAPDDPDNPDDPDDPDEPSEPDSTTYHTPLLPFIPNFDFNLSSIWYYVTNWVNSFKGFMTLLFNVWSVIPYAIVLPVYATAVIVVVVGVYRKFFM